jgi:hypothetical protein
MKFTDHRYQKEVIMTRRRAAWSPYRDMVVAYVRSHPGCSKLDVARHVTRDPRRTPSKQYYIVDTAIRHGWIVGIYTRGRYLLYAPDMVPPHLATEVEDHQPRRQLAEEARRRWGADERLRLPPSEGDDEA